MRELKNIYYISNDKKSVKRSRKGKHALIYPISHFSAIKTAIHKFKVQLQNSTEVYYRPANGKTVPKCEQDCIFTYEIG